MARVELFAEELGEGGLPPVCIRCGEPADSYVRWQFVKSSPWSPLTGLFGYASYRRARLFAPVCRRHRLHRTWRWSAILAGFVLLAAWGGFASMALDL